MWGFRGFLCLIFTIAICGKCHAQSSPNPIPDEKYDLARCIAWASAFTEDIQASNQSTDQSGDQSAAQSTDPSPFVAGILNSGQAEPILNGTSSVWTNIANTPDLAQAIGQGEVNGANQDGKNLYQAEKSLNDISGALNFDKMCVATYQKLNAPQQ